MSNPSKVIIEKSTHQFDFPFIITLNHDDLMIASTCISRSMLQKIVKQGTELLNA